MKFIAALPKQLKQDIIRILHSHSRRARSTVILEGKRLVSDVFGQSGKLEFAVVEHGALEKHASLLRRLDAADIPLYTASSRDFEALTDTMHSQGILAAALLNVLTPDEAFASWKNAPALFAFHEISDPGNLGTMIRTQDWFGFPHLFLSGGSVHPSNPKIVRATMGSLFRVAISSYVECSALFDLTRRHGFEVTVASSGQGANLFEWRPPQKTLVVLGSEAHGLSQDVMAAADRVITIPGSGQGESLNLAVAHGIIASHLSRSNAYAPSSPLLK